MLTRLLAALHAIVVVHVARRAEGLVVESRPSSRFVQFFAELVEGTQVIGGGRNLDFAGLEKFLVAPVEQTGDLAAEHTARTDKQLDRAIGSSGNLRRAAVFAHLEGVWSAL